MKQQQKKTPEKCKTCVYALGEYKTLAYPCPICTGETSIFEKGAPAPLNSHGEAASPAPRKIDSGEK